MGESPVERINRNKYPSKSKVIYRDNMNVVSRWWIYMRAFNICEWFKKIWTGAHDQFQFRTFLSSRTLAADNVNYAMSFIIYGRWYDLTNWFMADIISVLWHEDIVWFVSLYPHDILTLFMYCGKISLDDKFSHFL